MTKRIITFALALIMCITLLPGAVFAESGSSVQSIFNSTSLTPRQSVNPTLAKYVKEVMKEIDPKGTFSTYEKAKKAYEWVRKNIAFAAKYQDSHNSTYMEAAAIYGFENKKGPCEVDSATLLYLLRYIGLDAQWAYGKRVPEKEGSVNYHLWVEVLIGDATYIFDPYPGIEISFTLHQNLEMGATKVNGFTHYGYVKCYTKEEAESSTAVAGNVTTKSWQRWKSFDIGNMDRMRALSSDSGTGSVTVPVKYADGTSFTWGFPCIGTEEITMASVDKFYAPASSKMEAENNKIIFGHIAGRNETAYRVKAGTKISLVGASGLLLERLEKIDGKYRAYQVDKSPMVTQEYSHAKTHRTSSGHSYEIYQKGDYISINKEGYYILKLLAWNKYDMAIDPEKNGNFFGGPNWLNAYRSGYAVIRVVK